MENRNSGRISVGKSVRCTSARRVFDAYVYNVSKSGCMIELPGARMREGSLVALSFTEPVPMDGKVVWHSGANAGVCFMSPLHDAVIRFLGYDPSRDQPVYAKPVDRFGRSLGRLTEHR